MSQICSFTFASDIEEVADITESDENAENIEDIDNGDGSPGSNESNDITEDIFDVKKNPELIKTMCKKETIPENYDEIIFWSLNPALNM